MDNQPAFNMTVSLRMRAGYQKSAVRRPYRWSVPAHIALAGDPAGPERDQIIQALISAAWEAACGMEPLLRTYRPGAQPWSNLVAVDVEFFDGVNGWTASKDWADADPENGTAQDRMRSAIGELIHAVVSSYVDEGVPA